MRISFHIVLFLLCTLLSAQETQFLYQVGAVDSLYSNILKESRDIYVQIPESYDLDKGQKYPVAYLLDGEVFLPTLSTVQDFYSGGFTPEMVLIGISNSQHRTRDLTTSTITSKYGMSFNEENGKAADFLKFIEEELIPYVESKYPVTSYRTLIGHSYGGLFTLYSLLNRPVLFDNYLSIDPSLDWDNQKFIEQAKSALTVNDFSDKSLYMTLSGQLHMQNPEITIDNVMHDLTESTLFARSNIMFSNLIEENKYTGFNYKWKFYPNNLHGTIAFPSIKDGLVSLFEWFQMENTDKFNSPETSKDELKRIVTYRADKLQHHFKYEVPPYPEDLFNALGYMSLEMEQPEKSKMYFELNLKYYPKSANAYDSIADYYANQKDYDNALKSVTKAYELSGTEYHKERIKEFKLKIEKG
tara:strand:+ start:546 stop:1787 length:1242 start_codon:yes stop_codon:yes gene_type:complete